jgi:aspartyl-tRNA(Asn)/glutamyl-tRNA(Gln) amidotransferase subunit B
LIIFAGISDCDMEKGQMRCDANVSLRLKGSDVLGTRTEMKNLNSISNVKSSIEYEIKRQAKILDAGESVIQETRRWDASKNSSFSLRSKEEAHDYRYFPDPDLMPVSMDRNRIEALKEALPERPLDRQRRYQQKYALPYTITSVLCADIELSDFFESALSLYDSPKAIANYIVNDLLRELSAHSEVGDSALSIKDTKMKAENIAELVEVVESGIISKQIAKEVFSEMFVSGESPKVIIEKKDLSQDNDDSAIESLCLEAIANNPKAVGQFKEGNAKAINALKGPIMKATKGKANPATLDALLQKLIQESE